MGVFFRSIITKLVVLALIFAVVPVILYFQFREAHDNLQSLLRESVQQQGRLIARAIEPVLNSDEGRAVEALPARLSEMLNRLATEGITIRILLRPVNVAGVKGFYYVAAAPAVSAAFLANERSEFIRQGILDKLAPACDGGIERALRYRTADGTDEIVTSMIPLTAEAGCWILVTSHSTAAFQASNIGKPYWSTPEMRTAAVIYAVMVVVTFGLFGGVWGSLRKFQTLAQRIRLSGASEQAFQTQNRIPELTSVAQEFDRMVEALQNSARSIRRAAEDNAHAFKTPIAVMRQCFEPLERAVSTEDRRGRRALEVIGAATDRLDGLVSVARRMDEAEAELIDPPRARIDLSRMLERLLARYRQLSDGRNIHLDIALADNVAIQGGEDLLEIVVENVMENAFSFTPNGGSVEVSLSRDKQDALLTIDDTGPGVSETDLERIFNRYFSQRVNGAGRTGDGQEDEGHMGIGLWVVRRNVQAMGGSVRAENRDGGGLRVVISMPMSR